jgi:hypothetical protein
MSRFAKLITTLFPDDPISQRVAENFCAMFSKSERVGEDRIEALLREGARVNAAVASGELDAQTGLAQLQGFASTVGTPEHLVNEGLAFLQAGGGLSAEEIAAMETPGAEPAQAPQAPQAPAQPRPAPAAPVSPLADRETLRRAIAKHEADMKAPQGSPEWRAYWREGGDAQYRAALEGLQASTDAMSKLGSVGPPVPSQPAPAPAPATTAPPAPAQSGG